MPTNASFVSKSSLVTGSVAVTASTTGILQNSTQVSGGMLPSHLIGPIQKKNVSLGSLPSVVEGVSLQNNSIGNSNVNGNNCRIAEVPVALNVAFSTSSTPLAASTPTELMSNKTNGGGSAHNLMSMDPKSLIVDDEPTTEWIPEIPFRNVS